MKMSLVRRILSASSLFLLLSLLPAYRLTAADFQQIEGAPTLGSFSKEEILPTAEFSSMDNFMKNVDAGADIYEYVGENLVARGHVVIKAGSMKITADKAVINIVSQDIEASGNITFSRMSKLEKTVDRQEYEELLNDYTKQVEFLQIVRTPTGGTRYKVQVTSLGMYVRADRLVGNLRTGIARFQNFAIKTGALYAAAKYAERRENGEITIENARMTTCEYITDDHDHYAITASKAVVTPRKYESGLSNYTPKHQEHSILAYNAMFRLWDIPVFWVPAAYKPRETDGFGVDLALGYNSSWGVWVRTAKGFTLMQDPYVNVGAMVDYYSNRGVGAGGTARIMTKNSKTEFFGYGIHDRDPYESWDTSTSDSSTWYKNNNRLKIPKDRYDIKVTHLSHLTPRLDVRAQFELLSDYNFLKDYFETRYNQDIQPATFASMEYQFDRATAAVYTNVRVNDFYTTLNRLPEGRLDFPRQELFKGLYYQGENSASYLDLKWRRYDKQNIYGNLDDYSTGRFDSLHMFYYPLYLFDMLNIVPRAGVRMTAYTTTSDRSISDEALMTQFLADSVDAGVAGATPFVNYKESNQAQFRVIAEFGVEANTKIYRTWQNVKSAWLGLDGLRHVLVPYVNYNYIPRSNVDSDTLMYFDDLDRLKEQHFIRFGMVNRLQTRQGIYGSEQIREWFSMENYWDFHMRQTDGYNQIGDLGTRISFTPFDNLTLTSLLLLDIGENNDHDSEATRAYGKSAGRPGLSQLRWINKWNTTLSYKFAKDWKISASYIYSDEYAQRSVYSMGSMLDTLNSTTSTLKAYYPRSQHARIELDFPTYIDPKMTGGIYLDYDVDAALMNDIGVKVIRNFHCFNVGMSIGSKTTRDSDQDKTYSYYINAFIGLSAMPSARIGFGGSL